MASDYDYKEVRYDKFCRKCKYWGYDDYESVCDECLDIPINLYSERPINYVEDESRKEQPL